MSEARPESPSADGGPDSPSSPRYEQREDGCYACCEALGTRRTVTLSVGPFPTLEAAREAMETDVTVRAVTYCYPVIDAALGEQK